MKIYLVVILILVACVIFQAGMRIIGQRDAWKQRTMEWKEKATAPDQIFHNLEATQDGSATIHWKSKTGAEGHGLPVDTATALAWIDKLKITSPDFVYWITIIPNRTTKPNTFYNCVQSGAEDLSAAFTDDYAPERKELEP